jgi:short-subunit dehydrogenase
MVVGYLCPFFQTHSEGQILNVSSCFAWLGYPRKTACASSKAVIRAFSESLRWEIAESGEGVVVLYPGPLHNSLISTGVFDSAEQFEREQKKIQGSESRWNESLGDALTGS